MTQGPQSKIFDVQRVDLAGEANYIVQGGRKLFARLGEAFKGIRQVGVIGWASQGPAQAQNLRESLASLNVKVKVGLRERSRSFAQAEAAGFSRANGTLGEMFDVIRESDLVLLLISDAAQTELYPEIFQAMRPGATLGLSHGFLLGYLDSVGESFPSTINVIGCCPKGMGPSVRRLYEQGRETDGAGINCSVAVLNDVSGSSLDVALGWAVGLGAPYVFFTTLGDEYRSDIFGERGVLLGAVHGISESLYRWKASQGQQKEQAFLSSAKCITATISKMISRRGMQGVYHALSESQKREFGDVYGLAYRPLYSILLEIYEDVANGNEIRSVISATKRSERIPIPPIGTTEMWSVGRRLSQRGEVPLDVTTAAIYIAAMMAQADVLREKGHSFSEIVNESIIEAVDSLNPYMDFRDVAFMVDNCSTTARLGARKWAPRFDYAITQEILPKLEHRGEGAPSTAFQDFLRSPVHSALEVCLRYRPSVDIAVLD